MNVLIVNHKKSMMKAIEEPMKKIMAIPTLSEGMDKVIDEIQKNDIKTVIIHWTEEDRAIDTLCKKIRKTKLPHYVHILLVPDREVQKKLDKAIEAGADDFIFKPFGKEDFLLRLKLAKKTAKLQDTLIKSRKSLMKLAKEDPHTGLLNRRSLMDEVLKEMGRASRKSNFISSILISLANYKDIIDEHGTLIADEALVEFSNRLIKSCRPYDLAGRYGIYDFLVFMPEANGANAQKVAERIMKAVERPITIKRKKVEMIPAIGISELDPDDIAKRNNVDDNLMNDLILDSLIRRSELAMKRAIDEPNKIVRYSFE